MLFLTKHIFFFSLSLSLSITISLVLQFPLLLLLYALIGNQWTWIRHLLPTGRRRAIWAPWSAVSQTRAPYRRMKEWPFPSWMHTPAAHAVRQMHSDWHIQCRVHKPTSAPQLHNAIPNLTHIIRHFVILLFVTHSHRKRLNQSER